MHNSSPAGGQVSHILGIAYPWTVITFSGHGCQSFYQKICINICIKAQVSIRQIINQVATHLRCVEDDKSKEMSWQSLNHPSTLRLITVLKHFLVKSRGSQTGFSNERPQSTSTSCTFYSYTFKNYHANLKINKICCDAKMLKINRTNR